MMYGFLEIFRVGGCAFIKICWHERGKKSPFNADNDDVLDIGDECEDEGDAMGEDEEAKDIEEEEDDEDDEEDEECGDLV